MLFLSISDLDFDFARGEKPQGGIRGSPRAEYRFNTQHPDDLLSQLLTL